MDNVITLIVILIAVWSILTKLKAKRKKRSGAKPAHFGWIATLKAFLSDIQRQIEEQSKNRTGDASGWDRFLDESQTDSASTDVNEAVLDDRVLADVQTVTEPKKMPPTRPVRVQPPRSDRTQFVPAAPRPKASPVGRLPRKIMVANRADLRQAVIWSEILGPPVALRDQSGNQNSR